MNNVSLIGRLARDVMMQMAGETQVARFTVAVSDGYGENERTSFIPIVVFGKQAENCSKYLAKGRQVGITGRIQTGSYEKDGKTVYTTDVIASRVEFLGGGGASVGGSRNEAPKQEEAPATTGFVVDEDIPF